MTTASIGGRSSNRMPGGRCRARAMYGTGPAISPQIGSLRTFMPSIWIRTVAWFTNVMRTSPCATRVGGGSAAGTSAQIGQAPGTRCRRQRMISGRLGSPGIWLWNFAPSKWSLTCPCQRGPENSQQPAVNRAMRRLRTPSHGTTRAMADAQDRSDRVAAGRAPARSQGGARDLARFIDHTLLRPGASREEIEQLCAEAREHGFATVCVWLEHVAFCAERLAGSRVRPICVVGFPTGEDDTAEKVRETREALAAGAAEIDMVIRIPEVKAKRYGEAERDIRAVVEAASGRPVKVILETGALSRDEKVIGCALAKAAGAAFVKTSTGFGPGGATVADVALMRAIVGEDMGVKASGGVRTTADALRMLEAGADRLGTSASVAIVRGSA